MAVVNTVVDLIGYLAWPAVVIGIALFFRDEIKSFLSSFSGMAGRLKKAGPLEFQDPVGHQGVVVEVSQKKEDVGKALETDPLPDDPTLRPWIEPIQELIQRKNLSNAPDLKDRLIRELAWSNRYNDFSNIGRQIFGTQVAALREIAASAALPAEALQRLHAEHEVRVFADGREANPLDFLSWVAFLRDQRLIAMDEQGRYAITPIGRTFVQFAAANSVTEARLY
ncbi:MAG: hypothetical protein GC150_00580 [Rhizobiales bacterium]|nr:hypothetical protein [Hyphomicrobiales bacterium]